MSKNTIKSSPIQISENERTEEAKLTAEIAHVVKTTGCSKMKAYIMIQDNKKKQKKQNK